MKTPYEATLDIVIAKVSSNDLAASKFSGTDVAEFAQIVFDKMQELYNKQIETFK